MTPSFPYVDRIVCVWMKVYRDQTYIQGIFPEFWDSERVKKKRRRWAILKAIVGTR